MDNNEKSNLSMHDIYNSPQSKENLKEQTDWLSIDVDEKPFGTGNASEIIAKYIKNYLNKNII